ncbi:MAG: FtsQ-type POTRA domain-containing protein [Oscillospiraceae bacterium]|nr:FtsQ-type POTRA domain-containing protein [Oscillospiraceae bacterium]MDD7280157.1 FtsQ-type POTRA domain-containing protein [Oscillospiraceae bacterium]MDY2862798.1 FtsQ-type POTRA domain-containing protein [Oscillospiraceae bacterium]
MSYTRKKKKNNSATGILVFLFAAAVFLLLSTTVFFNVENITVSGASNYTADEIIEASGIKAGDNLVRTSTDKCVAQIESRLVYIENAKVTRSFPSTLVITVEASVPAANFVCDDYILLISGGGKVLDKIQEEKAGLLDFMGTDPMPDLIPGAMFKSSDEHKDNAVKKLMEYFAENGSENITSVDVTDRSEISYTYDGRITVKIGSINDLEYKMKFSEEIIRTKIGEKTEGVLTILSDSSGASFLDKESLENNARIYGENMELRNAAKTAGDESSTETSAETSAPVQSME